MNAVNKAKWIYARKSSGILKKGVCEPLALIVKICEEWLFLGNKKAKFILADKFLYLGNLSVSPSNLDNHEEAAGNRYILISYNCSG